MDFDSLPIEIKFKIFSYLTSKELHLRAALVSKDWFEITRDPFLRSYLRIINLNENPEKILQLLQTYNRAWILQFTNQSSWKWIIQTPTLDLLRLLDFQECHFETSNIVSKLLAKLPYVTNIIFYQCTFAEFDCRSPFASCQFLNYISITNYDSLRHPDNFLETCTNIEHLICLCSCFTESSFQTMMERHGANLISLMLTCEELPDASFILLNNCHKLRYLYLDSATQLTNEGLWAIKELTQLKILIITNSNADLNHLFLGTSFSYLTTIHIDSCLNLQNDALQLIAESCPVLRVLDIFHCHNNLDFGLQEVVDKCSNMEGLYLRHLNETTGKFLKSISSHLPKLKELSIKECPSIPKYLLYQVKVQRPDIRILPFRRYDLDVELGTQAVICVQWIKEKCDAFLEKIWK